MRILLVDDNPDQLRMLHVLITGLGHEVRVASSGLSAIEVARSFKPELAFIDLALPTMGGHEVARILKDEFPSARLYAMTARGGDEEREKSLQAGFHDHLVKPVDFGVVESLLKRRAV